MGSSPTVVYILQRSKTSLRLASGLHFLPAVDAATDFPHRCPSEHLPLRLCSLKTESPIRQRRWSPCPQAPVLALYPLPRRRRRRTTLAMTADHSYVAVRMSEIQETRQSTFRQKRTPEPKPPVVGSSCTWRDRELSQFNVTVQSDVDPRLMIPQRFFTFDHLKYYRDCSPHTSPFPAGPFVLPANGLC